MCSLIAHVVLCVLVLVGVGHVTVVIVHIGLDDVLVVIHFCVAIFVVICCIRRCSLYKARRTLSSMIARFAELSFVSALLEQKKMVVLYDQCDPWLKLQEYPFERCPFAFH